jgi:hypothetical protein
LGQLGLDVLHPCMRLTKTGLKSPDPCGWARDMPSEVVCAFWSRL